MDSAATSSAASSPHRSHETPHRCFGFRRCRYLGRHVPGHQLRRRLAGMVTDTIAAIGVYCLGAGIVAAIIFYLGWDR